MRERNEKIRQALTWEMERLAALRGNIHSATEETAHSDHALHGLTPRELQVLRCIAEGCSTKETACRLAISFKTAACHRHRVMQKVGVHGTGALVRFAIAHGVVSVPSES